MSAQKREHLFDILSTNLSLLVPEVSGIVVCPICHSSYGKGSLIGADPDLTLEHCIPESVSSPQASRSLHTLTCKKCNNQYGSLYDSHLKAKLQAADALEGIGGKVDCKLSIEGQSFRCNAEISQNNQTAIHFTTVMKASDPRKVETAVSTIESARATSNEFRGQFELNLGYSESKSKVALIKAGFLLMFRQFGYTYCFSEGPQFIRQLINRPNDRIVNAACGLKIQGIEQPIANQAMIITSPEELRCFLMPIELSTDHSKRIEYVIFPGFDSAPASLYDRWENVGNCGQTSAINYTSIDNNNHSLTDPQEHGAVATWDLALGQFLRRLTITKQTTK